MAIKIENFARFAAPSYFMNAKLRSVLGSTAHRSRETIIFRSVRREAVPKSCLIGLLKGERAAKSL